MYRICINFQRNRKPQSREEAAENLRMACKELAKAWMDNVKLRHYLFMYLCANLIGILMTFLGLIDPNSWGVFSDFMGKIAIYGEEVSEHYHWNP